MLYIMMDKYFTIKKKAFSRVMKEEFIMIDVSELIKQIDEKTETKTLTQSDCNSEKKNEITN